MSFDWKKLDRDQRERDARLTPVLGAVWLIGGVVTLAAGFLAGHLSRGLVSSLFWVVLGAGTLVVGIGLRKRNRRAAEQVGDEPNREPGPAAQD